MTPGSRMGILFLDSFDYRPEPWPSRPSLLGAPFGQVVWYEGQRWVKTFSDAAGRVGLTPLRAGESPLDIGRTFPATRDRIVIDALETLWTVDSSSEV